MEKDFPYLKFIEIARECRLKLINDTLYGDSIDLYDALYSDVNTEIYDVKIELYELEWVENHWEKIIDIVENKDITLSEKKELISMFAKWYEQFVSNWNYSEFDVLIFEDKMNILKSLISIDNEWERSIKKMKVSLEQSKKSLKARIKALEEG
jgi:hypothetical protein